MDYTLDEEDKETGFSGTMSSIKQSEGDKDDDAFSIDSDEFAVQYSNYLTLNVVYSMDENFEQNEYFKFKGK